MKSSFALAVLLLAGILQTDMAAGQGVPASVHYIGHEAVAAALPTGGTLVNDPGLTIRTQHRGTGAVEFHDHTNHIFLVLAGEATVITGGTMVGASRSSPSEMRADRIEGGQTHHLTRGDVLTIPARTPHWWKEVPSKTVDLYTVNIEN
jgi:mannose-6-phosphate isomerase-like protein (cupin superfamily)